MTVEKQGDSTEVEQIGSVTSDLTEENVQKLIELFPDVATEVLDTQTGETKCSVNFDALRERLGDVAEGPRERYQFTWPGKRAAKAEARMPIAKTMRPVKQRSKNWDETKNLYIEGDNLDALKILRETYAGKVKMIYIDPPYNTGHDFIYKDDFGKTVDADKAESGDYDEDGRRLVANPESNGRFHSDWCSMIYPRLLVAKDLLTSDGVIFISIDDNEESDLQNICNEIFGAQNFVANFIWRKVDAPNDNHVAITPDHEYIVAYCKNFSNLSLFQRDAPEITEAYRGPDENGRYWRDRLLRKNGKNSLRSDRPTMFYPIIDPDGNQVLPLREDGKEGCWALGVEGVEKAIYNETLNWKKRGDDWVPYVREYADSAPTKPWMTIWSDLPAMRQTKTGLKELFGSTGIFDTPKPPELVRRLMNIVGVKNTDLVLDFFSGSASTAHAVMQLNAADGGVRRFIMVQLPEKISEKSEASEAGYRTICEFGEERIRRAGDKVQSDIEANNQQPNLDGEQQIVPDIGFRVLRIESSNYKDMRLQPELISQEEVDGFVMNEKPERTPLDLLFEALPSFQLEYSSSIETLTGEPFDGYTVFSVNGGQLIACFDANIPESLVRAMANRDPRPSYVVVAEKSLPDSAARTNFEEIFKQVASSIDGATKIRII